MSNERVLTCVFTDLVGWVDLHRTLGATEARRRTQRHKDIVQELQGRHGGEIVDVAGDGFFLVFGVPKGAVLFGLELLQRHAREPDLPPVRIGMDLGTVMETRSSDPNATKRVDYEGWAVQLASRVMALADESRLLLTSRVGDDVRRELLGEEVGETLRWHLHGAYQAKGLEDELLEICEIVPTGIGSVAEPSRPKGNAKIKPVDSGPKRGVEGWRPSPGQQVPGEERWVLDRFLGKGGFGEVWLAREDTTGEERAFKFCFDADHLTRFQREVYLLRRMNELLRGKRAIAAILDYRFDKAPYYLATAFSPGGTLLDWARESDPVSGVDEATRMEIVANIADALAQAHDVGIIHRDVKPSNVLMEGGTEIRLTDFGLSFLDREHIELDRDRALETQLLAGDSDASTLGTAMYLAPELHEGGRASIKSDIFALGVLLYQMAIGDFRRALGAGWRRDVPDKTLQADIARCVDRDPERRLAGAGDVASRLRTLPERRIADERAASRARRDRRIRVGMVVLSVVLAVVSGFYFVAKGKAEEIGALNEDLKETISEKDQALKDAERQRGIAQERSDAAKRSAAEADENRKRAQAGLTTFLVEQGRRALLDGDGQRAAAYLAAAHGLDAGAPSLAVLLPRAVALADAEQARLTGHSEDITGLLASPDGSFLVTGSRDGTAKRWNAETGRLERSFDGHLDAVNAIALTNDGKRLATGSADGTARVWDCDSGALLVSMEPTTARLESITCLARSPDGERILIGSIEDRRVRVLDATSGRTLLTLEGHDEGVRFARFNPSRPEIATVGIRGEIRIWDDTSGRLLRAWQAGATDVTAVAYNDRGTLFATAGLTIVHVWRAGELHRATNDMPSATIVGLAFTPASERILVATQDGAVRTWDSATDTVGTPVATIEQTAIEDEDDELCTHFVVNERGTHACVCTSKGRVLILDLDSFKVTYKSDPLRVRPMGAWMSPDGSHAVVCDRAGDVIRVGPSGVERTLGESLGICQVAAFTTEGRLDAALGDRIATVPLGAAAGRVVVRGHDGHRGGINALDFSDDGSRLLTGGTDGRALIWDTESGRAVVRLRTGNRERAHDEEILSVRFSVDGSRVATGSGDRTARVWNAESGEVEHELAANDGQVFLADFADRAGSNLIVTACYGRTANVWDAGSGKQVATLGPTRAKITCASVSSDGTLAILGTSDGAASLWRLRGEQVAELRGHSGWVRAAAFDRGGERAVTVGDDGTARVWDARSGRAIASHDHGNSTPRALALYRGGRRLATASSGGAGRIWRLESEGQLARVKAPAVPTTAAHHPRKDLIAMAGRGRGVGLWDGKSPECERILDHGDGWVASLQFNADGSRLLTAGGKRVVVWDTGTWELIHAFESEDDPYSCAQFSPDGSRVVACTRRRRQGPEVSITYPWQLWDTESGEELARSEGPSEPAAHVAINSDLSRILTCGDAGNLWYADDGKHRGDFGKASCGCFSPDGNQVATAGSDGSLSLWHSWFSQRTRWNRSAHSGTIRCVAFSTSGSRLVSGGADGIANVWSGATLEPIAQAEGHDGDVLALTFSPDDRLIATAGRDATARIWDATSGQPLAVFEHGGAVVSLCFCGASDELRLLTASEDGFVRAWRVARRLDSTQISDRVLKAVPWGTGRGKSRAPDPNLAQAIAMLEAVDPGPLWVERGRRALVSRNDDARALTCLAEALRLEQFDGAIPFLLAECGHNWSSGRLLLDGHAARTNSVHWSPDAKRIVTLGFDGHAKIWDTRKGDLLHDLEAPGRILYLGEISKDGRRLAVGGSGSEVCIWDLAHPTKPAVINCGHSSAGFFRFSPDSRQLVTRGPANSVMVWDAATGSALHTLEGLRGLARSAAFSADGTSVAGGTNDQLVVWNLETGEQAPLEHEGRPEWLEFDPRGRWLASGGADKTARVYDPRTGVQVARLDGHGGPVDIVLFSPDGTRLLTATLTDPDATVRVWATESWTLTHSLPHIWSPLNNVDMSADGKLVTTSGDGDTAVWELATGRLVADFLNSKGQDPWTWAELSPDATRLAVGSGSGSTRVYRLDGAAARTRVISTKERLIHAASDDSDETVMTLDARGGIDVWSTIDGRRRSSVTLAIGEAALVDGAIGPERTRVVTVDSSGTPALWRAADGTNIGSLDWSGGAPDDAVFNGDGTVVALGRGFELPRLYDTDDGAPISLHTDLTTCRTWAWGDVNHLLTGHRDGTIRTWNARNGEVVNSAQVGTGAEPVGCIAVRARDGLVAAATGRTTHLVRQGGTDATTLYGPRDDVIDLAFDGARLVLCCRDGSAWMADVTEGTIKRLDGATGIRRILPGRGPSSSIVVTVNSWRSAEFWHKETGRQLGRAAFDAGGDMIALSSGGRYLLGGRGRPVLVLRDLSAHDAPPTLTDQVERLSPHRVRDGVLWTRPRR